MCTYKVLLTVPLLLLHHWLQNELYKQTKCRMASSESVSPRQESLTQSQIGRERIHLPRRSPLLALSFGEVSPVYIFLQHLPSLQSHTWPNRMPLLRLTVSPRVVTTVYRATVMTEVGFFHGRCSAVSGCVQTSPKPLSNSALIPTIFQILCKCYKYENDALRLAAAFQSRSKHEHIKLLIVVVLNNEVVIYKPVL